MSELHDALGACLKTGLLDAIISAQCDSTCAELNVSRVT